MKSVYLAALFWVGVSALAGSVFSGEEEYEGVLGGHRLARELRDRFPAESSTLGGEMEVKPQGGEWRKFPIIIRVFPGINSWTNTYDAILEGGAKRERLTIIHEPGESNRYFISRASRPDAPYGEPEPLTNPMTPFAGSDFWAADFGLEYLDWPEQEIIIHRIKMRHNRPCYVLESQRPSVDDGGYARVLTWVDKETLAPVHAEAYDAEDNLIKLFTVRSVTKVDGEYQVDEIRMKDLNADSRTYIEYDYGE